MTITPVILSGGSGTRLWPVSRSAFPKQLLSLIGEETLLQQAVRRAARVAPDSRLILVCNNEHRFQVAEQMRQAGAASPKILIEPVGRNTAPAIALAAFEALATDPEAILLVLPSDQLIKNLEAFATAVQAGQPAAAEGALITFGIVPDQPKTGYGYIKANGKGVVDIEQFVEKPDLATAERYLKEGCYYWNSGIFMFRADAYLQELKAHAPDIYESSHSAYKVLQVDLDFSRIPEEVFSKCPSQSIDYAVMEKTQNAKMVPLGADWSDLGSWQALWEAESKDEANNALSGDVLLQDVSNCYVRADSRLVSVLGVKDHIIVETADAVLVAHKSATERISGLVAELKDKGREEAKLHQKVYRPWGSYESVLEDDRFKVKRIVVKPGASLSLQMHHHRAEHWIVVKGTAKVTCGDKQYLVSENESTYIPLGTKHRLENTGTIDLALIEVQSGSYLGEDDIVRFEDRYGR